MLWFLASRQRLDLLPSVWRSVQPRCLARYGPHWSLDSQTRSAPRRLSNSWRYHSEWRRYRVYTAADRQGAAIIQAVTPGTLYVHLSQWENK